MSTDAEFFVSPEQRIKELNDIDRVVARVLSAASTVTHLLTNEEHDSLNPRYEDVESKVQTAVSDFYADLSQIEVRMRRQVYALEEAGLIAKGSTYDASRATGMNEDSTSRRGGGGPLDSSWLNARAKDTIGQGLKREILAEAKALLAKNKVGQDGQSQSDQDMESENGLE